MDELARKAGADPIAFRIRMLDKTPRLKAALQLVAEKSDWGQPLPTRTGRGVCAQPSFGSLKHSVASALPVPQDPPLKDPKDFTRNRYSHSVSARRHLP